MDAATGLSANLSFTTNGNLHRIHTHSQYHHIHHCLPETTFNCQSAHINIQHPASVANTNKSHAYGFKGTASPLEAYIYSLRGGDAPFGKIR
jgi:hypothetical protein